MAVLADFLHALGVGEPQAFKNLTLFPLLGTGFQEPGYLLLDEALPQDLLEVREVSETGSVNEVLVINKSDLPVLLMDGEILTGAKQNRVVNASILVGAHVELRIPVSCVEHGRWRYVAEKFTESRHFSYAHLRAQKCAQVGQSLHASGVFSADQGAIWNEVERKQREMRAESRTGAVTGVYERHAGNLREYCTAFSPLEGQMGAAVFINGRFVCLDAFDSPASLRALYPKMIESYALDALEQTSWDNKEPEQSAAEQLLEQIAATPVARYPSVGLGEDMRIKTEGLVGSCLILDDRVIHLALFAGAGREGQRRSSPLSRPRWRRQIYA